ncbi:MAG: hypothetical protein M0R17_09160 [Candidatus Omnitrophica bacterium]|jgi:hypothetical protein|nr:hypothetical protein [Candidatus Omnitrophota bacterium]
MIKKIKNQIKCNVDWDWCDVAIPYCCKISKTSNFSSYHLIIDFQFLWLNVWILLFNKNK